MKKINSKYLILIPLVVVLVTLFVFVHFPSTQAKGDSKDETKIPGQYIVVFKDGVKDTDAAISDLEIKHGLGHLYSYKHSLNGFAANISDKEINPVKNDSRVAYVVEDRIVSAFDNVQAERKDGPGSSAQPTQIIPTGVSRIGASSTYGGAGVTVAVIDTGINLTHPDLTANILNVGKTCIRRTTNANDDNGHGTHVAGIIAAANNTIGVVGVAPKAKLVPVKVLDRNGNGTWSSVICGIDWVTANATTMKIKVANMSLGGKGASDNSCGNTNNDPLHQAICQSTNVGVTYVAAAGNSDADASTFVPAAYSDTLITVSALADSDGKPGGLGPVTPYGPDDTFATFSNYGNVVELGAPGVNIFSTYKNGTYATLSGTSMASPHVAGAAALYIAANPLSLWNQVRDGLVLLGKKAGFGHTDPSGLHPEPVVNALSL